MGTMQVIIVFVLSVFFTLIPLKLAAGALNTERDSFGWCFLALLAASVLQALAFQVVPGYGNIVAVVLSAVAFMLVLGSGFFGGLAIALLHIVFSFLIGYLLKIFGFGQFANLNLGDIFKFIW